MKLQKKMHTEPNNNPLTKTNELLQKTKTSNQGYSSPLEEARRVMVICNACRYCEGLCPVFPEMTNFREFANDELNYLANLCHNCKGCYHGCQYAEPHSFNVNVPKVFSELRANTFVKHATPKQAGMLFNNNANVIGIATAIAIAGVFLIAIKTNGSNILFTPQIGEGSFFAVVPLALMSGIPTVITLLTIFSFFKSFLKFSKEIDKSYFGLLKARYFVSAIKNAATLKFLSGGDDNHGCTHVDEERTHGKKIFHHFTFYGFMLCFASTSIAAFYHHALNIVAPYPFTSAPVLLGIIGGIGLLVGPLGLTYVKIKSNPKPIALQLASMEYAFISQLFFISATGLLLMVARSTIFMPILLCIHLGFVYAFFAMLPYCKMMHAVYRLTALLKYAKNTT